MKDDIKQLKNLPVYRIQFFPPTAAPYPLVFTGAFKSHVTLPSYDFRKELPFSSRIKLEIISLQQLVMVYNSIVNSYSL